MKGLKLVERIEMRLWETLGSRPLAILKGKKSQSKYVVALYENRKGLLGCLLVFSPHSTLIEMKTELRSLCNDL